MWLHFPVVAGFGRQSGMIAREWFAGFCLTPRKKEGSRKEAVDSVLFSNHNIEFNHLFEVSSHCMSGSSFKSSVAAATEAQ